MKTQSCGFKMLQDDPGSFWGIVQVPNRFLRIDKSAWKVGSIPMVGGRTPQIPPLGTDVVNQSWGSCYTATLHNWTHIKYELCDRNNQQLSDAQRVTMSRSTRLVISRGTCAKRAGNLVSRQSKSWFADEMVIPQWLLKLHVVHAECQTKTSVIYSNKLCIKL